MMSTSLARPPQPPIFQVSRHNSSQTAYSDMTVYLGSNGKQRPLNPSLPQGRYKDHKKVRISHYAQPLQLFSSPCMESMPFEGTQVEEHMLRRKTPNGTLPAGYDGNQVEWTERPHAPKHLVMQVEAGQELRNIPRSSKTFRSLGGPRHKQQLRQDSGAGNARTSWDQGNAAVSNFSFHSLTAPLESVPNPPDHHQRVVLRMDSILNQSQALQQHYFGGGLSNGPSALQPGWVPSGGPTASNKQGQYGPYWPDGAFIPYRPAALRDARVSPNDGYKRAESLIQCNDQDLRCCDDFSGRPLFKPMYLHELARATEQFRSGAQQHSPIDLQGLSLESSTRGNEHLLPKGSPFGAGRSLETSACPHECSPLWQNRFTVSGTRTRQSLQDIPNHNLKFKERMLIEAHRAYLNLLASQQQARQQANSKILINDRLSSYMATQPPALDTIKSFQAGPSNLASSTAQYAGEVSKPTAPIYQNPESCCATNALAALEVLTQLCQESEWQWIDGILLGGCLAYALANYEKALQWYYRVLACDPK